MKISHDTEKNPFLGKVRSETKKTSGCFSPQPDPKDSAILTNSLENLINTASANHNSNEKLSLARKLVESSEIDSPDFALSAARNMLKFGI